MPKERCPRCGAARHARLQILAAGGMRRYLVCLKCEARSAAAWRQRNPHKRAAHRAVEKALRNGTIVRQPCEVCGERAHAHHDDYAAPLDVRWLCPVHHKAEHKNGPQRESAPW